MAKLGSKHPLAGLLFLLASSAHAFTYGPYSGFEGYQEMKVDRDTYYVAFHGDRKTSIDEVNFGWSLRAAQLCAADGATHFVELGYTFEPVLEGEQLGARLASRPDGAAFVLARNSGFVFIPMPMSRRHPGVIEAPSKLTPVRCISDVTRVTDPKRVVDGTRVLAQAKEKGIAMTP